MSAVSAPATPAIGVEVITPEYAESLLGRNTNNRNIRPRIVERYAHDMRTGNWRLTGAPIVFDTTGELLDGQHRLHACVLAETPFPSVLIRNADPSVKIAIDTGVKRTIADVLKWRGEVDTPALGAAIRMLWQIDNGVVITNVTPTVQDMLDYLDNHPGVRESLRVTRQAEKYTRLRRTALTVSHALISAVDADEADQFLDKLASGADLAETSPILRLRQWAANAVTSREIPSTLVQTAIILKAANAWREGRPVQQLAWRRGGANAEPFPAVWRP